MGEQIRREAATTPAKFSGERLTGAISGQIEIEHYHRYLLAREFCRGRDVLDVAAGEGYGTALLAQVARSAVGIEIDSNTVAAARTEFRRPNLRYEQGDARTLPLPDASVDVAVSFETLEHFAEQEVFLAELRRVLRPDGLLIISTPDRDTYSPPGSTPNPYHVLELTRAQFEALLRRHFTHSAMAAQRSLIGSVILNDSQDAPLRSYEKRGDTMIEGSEHLSRAPYLFAFASNAALPPLPNSVYVYRGDLDTDREARHSAEMQLLSAVKRAAEGERREEHASSVIVELQERATRLAEARSGEPMTRRLERAEARAKDAERLVIGLEQRLTAEIKGQSPTAAIAQRLRAIETSTTWRATWPLRQAGARLPGRARNLGRAAARVVWWALSLQLPARYRNWRLRQSEISASLLPENIHVPCSSQPVVSVIISTYGQVGLSMACLKSIANHPPRCPIEVILVDDAYSGPEDVQVLDQVQGIRLVRNVTNLGFLRSNNRAAKDAKGRYIYLLNNDTELQPGSIDALVELLEARPDAGMAGSKLIFPDGSLQEAGGILWDDASGWNYGRGQNSKRPEFNYVREVDYCSAASLMIRRTAFDELEGFDETFAPAYYEDADLAFRMREAGMKVLYQPLSIVLHREGGSHGTDVNTGIKAHQVSNKDRMEKRWKATLARENYPNGQHVLRARDRAWTRKVILVIDHYTPEPDRDAGSRSVMGIIESLLDAGWVVKFWPHNRAYSPIYTAALERRGIEVVDNRWPGDFATWMRENGSELDHVLAIRPEVAADILPVLVRSDMAVLSFYGVDLHFARMRRQADVENSVSLREDADRMEQIERRVWRHFDVVIYPSEEEAAAVRAMSPRTDARGIVPFWFDTSPPRTAPSEGRTILFVAGFAHAPNVDAAVFLINEVIPPLEKHVGPVSVVLAGSHPTAAVRALARPNVKVTGYVTDEELGELYERHRVSVVPLRFGAGVKGKVVESLSRGLPLVTTSIGAQGIDGLHSVVPVHDDVAGIVAALKLLLTDDAAWMKQSRAQTDFAERCFSREAMQLSVLFALQAGEVAAGYAEKTIPGHSNSPAA